ncbi:MAG: class I SAM-dependent methyltransferase [Fusobacteriales bacterium]|jgi:SAM-dependent methyltransferase|nr:class I SAM-dependent methyltransferase [Fusobacteriales bacterium]
MNNLYEDDIWDKSVPMRPGGMELTKRLLDISALKSGLIMDFGCGEGHTAEYLINKQFSVIGTDKSELLIKRAVLRCPKAEFFVLENMENLELQNKLDGVISECVIASLENKREIINKIHSFLKCGGIFIINDITAPVKTEADIFFTFDDWIETLNKSGFEIIYYEDNTSALKEFYLKALWENRSCCIADCIPDGYEGKEIGYFSIIAKKI